MAAQAVGHRIHLLLEPLLPLLQRPLLAPLRTLPLLNLGEHRGSACVRGARAAGCTPRTPSAQQPPPPPCPCAPVETALFSVPETVTSERRVETRSAREGARTIRYWWNSPDPAPAWLWSVHRACVGEHRDREWCADREGQRSLPERATAQRVPSGHVLYARRHVVLNELQLGFQVLHRVARVALGAAATVQGVRDASTLQAETAATRALAGARDAAVACTPPWRWPDIPVLVPRHAGRGPSTRLAATPSAAPKPCASCADCQRHCR